jgi:putative ABC transport system permease protein
MKAIGARNEDIMTMFLIESGILGLAGGTIGIIIGYLFAKAVELIAVYYLKVTLLKPFFPWYLLVGSLLFAFIVGALAGTLPAINASKLQPVEALRYE